MPSSKCRTVWKKHHFNHNNDANYNLRFSICHLPFYLLLLCIRIDRVVIACDSITESKFHFRVLFIHLAHWRSFASFVPRFVFDSLYLVAECKITFLLHSLDHDEATKKYWLKYGTAKWSRRWRINWTTWIEMNSIGKHAVKANNILHRLLSFERMFAPAKSRVI